MSSHEARLRSVSTIAVVAIAAGMSVSVRAQSAPATTTAGRQAVEAAPSDTLGRDTPRGTVLGFMQAARNARHEVIPLYLNTPLRDRAALELAQQLYVVLDSRLPPRLTELSDRPEGSLPNPLKPDQDVVGTIATVNGPLEIVLERVPRSGSRPVWLFSRRTLDAIPDAYAEIDLVSVDRYLPGFLTRPRIGGIRLFEWLALLLLVPLLYRATALPNRLLGPALVAWRRRRGLAGQLPATVMPGAVRLLLTAIAIRWALAMVELPLLERQFWAVIATMLAIAATTWGLLLLNAIVEQYVFRRLHGSRHGEVAAMLRLGRRVTDTLVIVAAGIVVLHYLGVDPTAALAGLGIGGIAVALAAQKTLENVVGGVSIILDKAVRVGDFLKLGDTLGTVDDIGLRSTRIRTLDRTILSVPNGQMANVNIETLSARDKFWFHHTVGVRYETTSTQMRAVVDGVRRYLGTHPQIDRSEPIRVRFFRFGASSLDVEVFAYILVGDWEAFLDTQQELLLEIMAVIERAGAVIALPSQVLQIADARSSVTTVRRMGASTRSTRLDGPRRTAESA